MNFDAFINEGKQVGLLYHYTYLIHAIQIVEENEMKIGQLHDSISFTRDKNFHKHSFIVKQEERGVRITVDGDKLSNNYKIAPYDYFGDLLSKKEKTPKAGGKGEVQAEERVMKNITNIKKYIVSIDLPDVNEYDSILLVRGNDVNDWIEKVSGEKFYKQKYVDLENANEWTMDAKEYFENKGFKVNFYK